MRFWILAAAVGAGLSACSPTEDTPAPADGPAVAALAGSASPGPASGTREDVYAAQSLGPEPFVRALYAQYEVGGPQGDRPAPGQEPLYSRTLNALVGADFRAANGEVPTLNYDPICACQDQADFAVTAVAVAQSAPNAAEANVSFTNLGEARTLTLKLVREGVNWKVDDVVDDGASLHDTLMKVAEAAA
ncbi:hypothetical protein BZG35_08695 [Brevundimonas sp. LM2]|nr:hypothetical protein BZG35_08695 [Brevundimonas sp. LM2]